MSDASAVSTTRQQDRRLTVQWSDVLVAGALVVLAIVLRAPGLDPTELWLDDAWVALAHRIDDPSELFEIGVTAPGFVFALKAIFLTVGFSEVAAQALPFAAGVVGPGVSYLVARRLGVPVVGSALAGLLVMVAPYHVAYSTTVKQFTADLVLVVLVLWLAWRTIEVGSKPRWTTLGVTAIVATVWSASVVPAVAAAIAAAAWRPLRAREWGVLAWPAAYGTFVGFWWLIIRNQVSPTLDSYWADYTAGDPVEVIVGLVRFVARFMGGHENVALALVLTFIVLFLLGLGHRVASVEHRLLLGGPLLFALFASLLGVPLGTGRTDVYLYAPTAIAIGLSLDSVVHDTRIRLVSAVALVLVGVVATPTAAYADPDGYRNKAVTDLLKHAQEGMGEEDVLLISWGGSFAAALYSGWDFDRVPDHSAVGWHPAPTDPRVHVLLLGDDGHIDHAIESVSDGRLWFLSTPRSDDWADETKRRLEQSALCTLRTRTSHGAQLVVCDR